MHTPNRLWTMDDAVDTFGDAEGLTTALRDLHTDVSALARAHTGAAIVFDQDGNPIVGPTYGQGAFTPMEDNAQMGKLYHGWLTSASAHARLRCASHSDAAKALWAILDSFFPDLHPVVHIPSFVLTGRLDAPVLAVASGPLRTGSAGSPWSMADLPFGIDRQIPLLWDLALRATHSPERFLTGPNLTPMRAASLADAHAILQTLGHSAHWAVGQPLFMDGIAAQVGKGFALNDTTREPMVRALGSALETVSHHLHTNDAGLRNLAVWMDTELRHGVERVNGATSPIPQPAALSAKRAFGRLAKMWTACSTTWGAPPRLVWHKESPTTPRKARAEAGGMVFDVSSPSWGNDRYPDDVHKLDPFVVPTDVDAPWWLAAHHDADKRSRVRLFQAADQEAAAEVCLAATRASLHTGQAWHPFLRGRLALWPVTPPQPLKDTTP